MSIEEVAKSPFAIGALGAMVTALKSTPGASWMERGMNILSGALLSGFLTPPLTDYLKMSGEHYRNGAAFMLGLLGMSLVAAVFSAVKETKWSEIISGWLARR